MSDNVFELSRRRQPSEHAIVLRLRRMASILAAIDAGELLAALPACESAQRDHTVALDLLEILSDEIEMLRRDL